MTHTDTVKKLWGVKYNDVKHYIDEDGWIQESHLQWVSITDTSDFIYDNEFKCYKPIRVCENDNTKKCDSTEYERCVCVLFND